VELLNLGVLAHVDAGKTTLTERLLFEAGAIAEIGSVDKGTTQTDSLELERRRGITIRSAVASFAIGDVGVNLIDTPGHPDFIAEVERALGVLDGAVLVVSAVEGVQPQTRILMRALQRGGVPTLLFINKIDRLGADVDRTLEGIASRLSPSVVPLAVARDLGTRDARAGARDRRDAALCADLLGVLAEHSDVLLGRYVAGRDVGPDALWRELERQVAAARVHPVFVGSALTGAGCVTLRDGIASLLPKAPRDRAAPASGRVFKIERSASGGKLTYVRMHQGTLRVRERVRLGEASRPITAIDVFAGAGAVRCQQVAAGEIGRLSGLVEARIGDHVGAPTARGEDASFPPPAMEAVVEPVAAAEGPALREALRQLAEQDPLINVRLEADGGLSVSLYGEVQKEVLASTLELEHGIAVRFRETTPICVERPVHTGTAVALLRDPSNPISATVGIRIDPLEPDSGVRVVVGIESKIAPIFIYKTHAAFEASIAAHVRGALAAGLCGWAVTDCLVNADGVRVLRRRRSRAARADQDVGGGLPPPDADRRAGRARASRDLGLRADDAGPHRVPDDERARRRGPRAARGRPHRGAGDRRRDLGAGGGPSSVQEPGGAAGAPRRDGRRGPLRGAPRWPPTGAGARPGPRRVRRAPTSVRRSFSARRTQRVERSSSRREERPGRVEATRSSRDGDGTLAPASKGGPCHLPPPRSDSRPPSSSSPAPRPRWQRPGSPRRTTRRHPASRRRA